MLTQEQGRAVDHLMANIKKRQVQTLGGYAGTGKTTVLTDLAHRLRNFGVVAFTGKAASILRRKGLHYASTIHAAIYDPYEDRGRIFFTKKPNVGFNGFLVDEASMVSKSLFDDLKLFGVPIIAIGDHGQLPPVGDDAGLMQDPQLKLETIHRNAGPIAKFAEHLRKRQPATEFRDDTGTVTVFPRGSRLDPQVAMRADQIICAYNKDRVRLNKRSIQLLKMKDKPGVGHRVICLRNSREFGVFNGMQGDNQGNVGRRVV